jgi:hypothetical protein
VPSIILPEDEGTAIQPQAPAIPIIAFHDEDGAGTDSMDIITPPPRVPSPSFTLSSAPTIQVSSNEASGIAVPTIRFPGDDGDDRASPSPSFPTIAVPTTAPRSSNSDSVRVTPGHGIFCASCEGVIIGRIVSAMNKRWHPDCFKCETCRMLLEHVSSYEHDGKAYCHMDYHDVSFVPLSSC